MKNFFELVNDERKSSDILPMKACGPNIIDYGCFGSIDAGPCTGLYSIDGCEGASDYSYCTGEYEHDI